MAGLGLIIPGLAHVPRDAWRAAPRLRALLQRARPLPACPPGRTAAIHAASGAGVALDALAFGPVCAQGEGDGDGAVPALALDAAMALAEPVSLAVHTDHVRFAGPLQPSLTHEEAAALVGAVNALWSDEGLSLALAHSGYWYLAGADVVALAGGLGDAMHWQGMRLDEALAVATDRRRLARLLTETQMLFHEHPVNQSREAQGWMRIDGLWLSGAGVRPPAPGCRARLLADEPYARGLMRLDGQPAARLPGDFAAALSQVLDAALDNGRRETWLCLSDIGDSADALAALEHDWIAPAWRALAGGRLGMLSWRDTLGRGGRLDRLGRLRVWARREL